MGRDDTKSCDRIKACASPAMPPATLAARRYLMRSITVQFACPPPSHMVCIP